MPRPVPSFHRFIGHKTQIDLVRRQLAGAKARGEPAPSMLILGPAGVGKTMLAKATALAYGSSLMRVHGSESVDELIEKCRRVNEGDFIFVDEGHRLAPTVQEVFYPLIDEYRVPNVATESPDADDSDFIEVAPCTVVVATNQPGKLQTALRSRMQLQVSLTYYKPREMKEIVFRIAADLRLLMSPQAAGLIAQISGGLPRQADHHLANLRRHYPESETRPISLNDVRQFLRAFRIDAKGLGERERDYLRFLEREGRASLAALAAHLGTDADDVAHDIEPPLRRLGFFTIESGRLLTEAGRQWIERSNSPRPTR